MGFSNVVVQFRVNPGAVTLLRGGGTPRLANARRIGSESRVAGVSPRVHRENFHTLAIYLCSCIQSSHDAGIEAPQVPDMRRGWLL